MKTKTIFISICLLLLTSGVSAQRAWTLEQCIDTALANNRGIKQQRLMQKSKEIAYKQSKNTLLPNLNANVNQDFSFGRSLDDNYNYQNSNSRGTSFGISSGLLLFDGMKMKYNIEARKSELLAAGADVQKVEKDIILNVSTVFLQALQNKEMLKNAENQLNITKENIERRTELIKVGKLAEGEIY